MLIIAVAMVRRAADLCELYALRAYDGVQLALAESLQTNVASRVRLASSDEALNRGASALGMSTL
jgi:predicted nucleic acid-binding protein